MSQVGDMEKAAREMGYELVFSNLNLAKLPTDLACIGRGVMAAAIA